MTDRVSLSVRSRIMSRIKSSDNQETEKRLIEIFRTYGVVGWRRGQVLPGRPDFTFRSKKLAVFVDGCFWHCCPIHGRTPAAYRNYWEPKLAGNKRRDRRACKQLRALGWKTVRVWQHELADERRLVKKLLRNLRRTRPVVVRDCGLIHACRRQSCWHGERHCHLVDCGHRLTAKFELSVKAWINLRT